ncbi:N-acetylmuramoyl-L-alanine amidase [Salinihabitans flavidus]|nr:N-acetylmuramoyl-L-alanine amidase [Salinihabitans flavidus]
MRRDGAQPSLIVLHHTAMQSDAAALERLCAPEAEVSAHYLIGAQGAVWRLVDEEARAWHAGAGQWGAIHDVNSYSIGIELDNRGDHPFSEPQMKALEVLLPQIMRRWGITAQGVIGHSDMAPCRKSDPGPRFDWRRLARQFLSVWPEPCPDPGNLSDDLLRFGYPPVEESLRLAVFRRRFRPWARGPVDAVDAALAADLAARWPFA